jgi:hypothetical protein
VRLLLQLFLRAELNGSVHFLFAVNFISTVPYLLFFVLQKCVVDLPGGPLEIEWREDNNHVYMSGPAEAVFYGSFVH